MATFGSLANFIRFFGMIYSDILGPDENGDKQFMDEALFVILSYCIPDIFPFALIQIFLTIKLKILNRCQYETLGPVEEVSNVRPLNRERSKVV